MKKANQSSKNFHQSGSISSEKNSSALVAPARRRMFCAVALCLPVFFFLFLEVVLRVCGVGVVPDFFIKTATEKNGEVWVENNLYTSLFFPTGLERGVHGFNFPVQKSPDTLRVFVFGESAALGDPNPTFGMSRILEAKLQKRFPAKKIEMVNLSVTAINSHVVREIARCAEDKEGDYWIIYMGNNEVVGPYGASTVFSSQTPPMALIRTAIALKRTYTGQLLGKLLEAFSSKGAPKRWGGMEMFLQKQVAWDDPQLDRVHNNFKSNLEAIVKSAKKAEAKVLLCTVAVNEHDCPAFGSQNKEGLLPEKMAQWKAEFEHGIAFEEKGDARGAKESYLRAMAVDSSYAELHFRLARCLENCAEIEEARKHYLRARDLDTIRFRTDSVMNSLIAQTAQDSQLELLDLASLLGKNSPTGLVGKETLLEHVHFSWNGNYAVASLIDEKLACLIEGEPDDSSLLSSEEAAAALGYTPYGEYLIYEEIKRRFSAEPFTFQAYHSEVLEKLDNQLNSLRAYAKSGAVRSGIADIKQSLETRPDDVELRNYLAYLMDSSGDFKGAIEEVMKIRALHPMHTQAEMTLASVLEKTGDLKSALQQYEYVLHFNPLISEALLNAARLRLTQANDPQKALRYMKKALRSLYDSPEALVVAGDIYLSLKDVSRAKEYYQEALQISPGFADALKKLSTLEHF